MDDWKDRLTRTLEPVLMEPDPRPLISSYHDMPYAIFHYDPRVEFDVREEIRLLTTRLNQAGKVIHIVSLANCLEQALEKEGMDSRDLANAERSVGLTSCTETVHEILSSYQPLDQIVLAELPTELNPRRDIVFLTRAGALFPVYRTSSLLEQLKGKVHVPAILFYPGDLDGAAGLRFMAVLDAEHNYRPKIF